MLADVAACGWQAGFADPVVDHAKDLLLSWGELLHSAVTLNLSTVLIYRCLIGMQRKIEAYFEVYKMCFRVGVSKVLWINIRHYFSDIGTSYTERVGIFFSEMLIKP